MIPKAEVWGAGWTVMHEPTLDVPTDSFRDGAFVSYGGPDGARVVLSILLVTSSRVAIRKSWEDATQTYQQVQYTLNYDYSREDQLGNVAPPAGCAEAKRVDGTGKNDGFPTGITQCAADPDIVILAVVSGNLGKLSGYAASDAAVTQVLKPRGGQRGTPTP